jgi:transcriptional regulator with XRE-family HTH domain
VLTVRVYEKVRAYIDEMGYKQVTIAEKAGIPKATFNAILNGNRTLYADDLKAICLALNVSPELFIDMADSCEMHE